jgi:hypothetical protein
MLAPLTAALLCLTAAPAGPLLLGAEPRVVPIGPGAPLAVRAAFREESLRVEVRVAGGPLAPSATLDVWLAFRSAGLTSGGLVLRLTPAGLAAPPELGGAEPWAQGLVRGSVRTDAGGLTAELAIPLRALPRFPARGPLLSDLCLEYAPAAGGDPYRSCPGGASPGGPLRLPEAWRAALALPTDVEGVEGRPRGWVGFSRLHALTWARGDERLTPPAVVELVAGAGAVQPRTAGVPIPASLVGPGGRALVPVLTGQAPEGEGGRCAGELTLSLYLVEGATARQVLRWPAATCQLGRVSRIDLPGDGSLVLGYTSGAQTHFTWTQDHFERTEAT